MEKRLFIAFFATLVFMTAWMYFSPKPIQEKIAQQPVISANAPENKFLKPSQNIQFEHPEESALPTANIGNVSITYSPKGGYLRLLSIKGNAEPLFFENIGFRPEDENTIYNAAVDGNKLIFKAGGGKKKVFSFNKYLLEINVEPHPAGPMLIFSNNLKSSGLDQRYQEVFSSKEGAIKRNAPKKTKNQSLEKVDFAGARDRYYCISLVKGSYDIQWEKSSETAGLYLSNINGPVSVYIGPQTEKELEPYGLQKIMYYGFFHAIGMLMVKILYIFYALTKSWGLSIILFAVTIYGVLFPFTMKSTQAMRKMQQIQPYVEELKTKFKDNPQKIQKETLQLYRKYKVNPLGGCLPLFLQFPIFIALYQVLFRFTGLKGASFLWIKDLSLPDRLIKLPFDIPFLGQYLNVLPLAIMVVGLIQQKITTSTKAASEQKSMGIFFSLFLGIIFYNFPSSLVLYWFVQNALTLLYQFRISKKTVL
ncbi:MAG: membrane protein insertase YidC [Candidatus Omnitrophica bacterium]|nr:membrane protein insertase YidC [Candidatus Omnitrophota bacterium]